MSYLLRPCTSSDIDPISKIECRAYHIEVPWSPKLLSECLKQNYHFEVLENQQTGAIVGYSIAQNVYDELHLLNIAVDPDYQNTGFGRRLMASLVQYANQIGMAAILLEVRTSNIGAIHLYESMEFERIGLRPNYYPIQHSNEREDAILMQRMLTVV